MIDCPVPTNLSQPHYTLTCLTALDPARATVWAGTLTLTRTTFRLRIRLVGLCFLLLAEWSQSQGKPAC
jgi:hypothetical protein